MVRLSPAMKTSATAHVKKDTLLYFANWHKGQASQLPVSNFYYFNNQNHGLLADNSHLIVHMNLSHYMNDITALVNF